MNETAIGVYAVIILMGLFLTGMEMMVAMAIIGSPDMRSSYRHMPL